MQDLKDLEAEYMSKKLTHDNIKKDLKERAYYMSREQLLIKRRLKRTLWNELKEIKTKIDLLQ
jgi:hypothetical protein